MLARSLYFCTRVFAAGHLRRAPAFVRYACGSQSATCQSAVIRAAHSCCTFLCHHVSQVIQLWLSWILPGFSQDRIKQFGATLRGMADDESKKPEPHSPAIFVDSKLHISADDLRLGSARAQSFILSNFAFFVILFDEFLRNFVRGGRAACENAEQLKQITKLACVLSGVCDTLEEFGRLAREVDPHQFKKQSDKSTRGACAANFNIHEREFTHSFHAFALVILVPASSQV